MTAVEPVRFLLVEDDDDHAALVIRSLSRSSIGHHVDHVADGAAALAFFRHEDGYADCHRPDVILLDLNLPKLNGHEVLSAIRSDPQLKTLPVVILSTSDNAIDRAKAYQRHANGYVVKPLDFADFRDLANALSEYWGVWNRPAPG